jgi:pimeloyl-ACP methyl ester carboxylesterase
MPQLRGRIAGVTVFRVQDAFTPLLRARAALDDIALTPRPLIGFSDSELIFTGTEELDSLLGTAGREEEGARLGQERWGHGLPTGLAHDHVGVVATGTLQLPRFRRESTGTLDAADGTFEFDSSGLVKLQSMTTIPLTLVLPSTPPPQGGYPVVIFGHGLGSSRHAALSFAEPLATRGMAVVAIDFDGHGSRYSSADTRNNTAFGASDFQGDATMRDGFGDSTGIGTTFDFLGGLRNFSRARDGIRQSVLDVSSMTLALRRGDYDLSNLSGPTSTPILNTERISYMGESFGTLVGGVLAAIEPEIELYVLDVPAAGIIDLAILNSPALASLLEPLIYSILGWDSLPERFDPEVAILQSIVDAADPLSFAPHVLRDRFSVGDRVLKPRHVVALEVLGDESIHNLATDSLARAMGLQLLIPFAQAPSGIASVDSPAAGNVDGQTAVIVQYGPAVHGENWSSESGVKRFVPGFPHGGEDSFPRLDEPLRISNPLYETLEQVLDILQGHQAGLVPSVKSTSDPR